MAVAQIFLIILCMSCQTLCEQRVYYIATEEISWDYAPHGRDLINYDQTFAYKKLEYVPTDEKLGHIYRKIIYQEYTDSTFSVQKDPPEYMGYLGPVLETRVGDELVVLFKNNASRDFTIHPHGVAYDKLNEGSVYGGRKGVSPGKIFRYSWNITVESGPDTDSGCVSHIYHSDVDLVRDVNSGLVGFILVCAKEEKPEDDIFLYVGIIDENLSWMSKSMDSTEDTNRMHAINGYVYGNMPNVTACLGTKTRFHIASFSTSDDVHAVRLFGHPFSFKRKRYDALPVYSGASLSAVVTPSEIGQWLFTSTSKHHIEGGMQTLISVETCGNSKPVIDISDKIRKYYISAKEVKWNGKNRLMFVEYTSRNFDEKVPRPQSRAYLGALGPLLKAEIGDVIKIVFYNKLNRTISIQPAGLRISKEYEGRIYNDSETGKIQTNPGEKRTYYWFAPQYVAPLVGENPCIPRYYTTDIGQAQTLVGPMLICQKFALNKDDEQLIGGEDFFLYILENKRSYKDINGFGREHFPDLNVCTGSTNRFHLATFGSHGETLYSTGDPFDMYGSTVSSVGLVPYLPVTVQFQPTREGIFKINNFPDEVIGLKLNVSLCGGHISNEEFNKTGSVTYLGIQKARWYFDRKKIGTTKWKQAQSGDSRMTPRYNKAIYSQYFSQNFQRPDSSRRLPSLGYLGLVFYASVGDAVKLTVKNKADQNFSIFTPGVLTTFADKIAPSETVNITWMIPQNVGPRPGDAECIAKTYYSNFDSEKDITTGLVGPFIICSKGIKADSSFKHTIIFFGEVDETKSWYFTENVKKNKLSISDNDLENPDFVDNNKIHVINGFGNGTVPAMLMELGKIQFIHFINIGFKFQSIHMPGIFLPKSNNHFIGRDVVGLHSGTSVSVKVSPKVIGKWRLVGYGTNKHWNEMSGVVEVPTSAGSAN